MDGLWIQGQEEGMPQGRVNDAGATAAPLRWRRSVAARMAGQGSPSLIANDATERYFQSQLFQIKSSLHR